MYESGLDFAPLHDAVRDGGTDVAAAAHDLGARAARLGVPLHEVFDHLERAFDAVTPSFVAVRAAAVAWAEVALICQADVACEDPLTSLATVPHLRSRLAQIYRGAQQAGRPADELNVVVVVEVSAMLTGHEIELALRALEVAEALRLVFDADETIAHLSPRRFAVLAAHERVNATTTSLVRLLVDRATSYQDQPRVWVEHLPLSADDVPRFLAGLCE